MEVKHQLGVSFSGNLIQIVELKTDHKNYSLNRMDEIETEIDFNSNELHSIIMNPDLAFKLVKDLSKVIKRNTLIAEKAAVTLCASSIFIIQIPVDNCLKENEFNEHIEWELSNFFPDEPVSIFNMGSFSLNSNDGVSKILLVAVRKDIVLFLKNIFSQLKIETSVFDIDHFATIQTLSRNYIDSLNGKTILIGLRNGFLDYSVLDNGKLIDYKFKKVLYQKDQTFDLAKEIITFIPVSDGDWYLFGKDLHSNLLKEIRIQHSNKIIEMLNPFKTLGISRSLPRRQELMMDRFYFAPAVGIAFRQL